MTIIVTTQAIASSSSASQPVKKVRTFSLNFSPSGLKPNSQYTFWCNGVNMTWACQQFGTKMGAGLMSDATGSLSFKFIGETNNQISIPNSSINKKHIMQLQDINGNVAAITIIKQTLRART